MATPLKAPSVVNGACSLSSRPIVAATFPAEARSDPPPARRGAIRPPGAPARTHESSPRRSLASLSIPCRTWPRRSVEPTAAAAVGREHAAPASRLAWQDGPKLRVAAIAACPVPVPGRLLGHGPDRGLDHGLDRPLVPNLSIARRGLSLSCRRRIPCLARSRALLLLVLFHRHLAFRSPLFYLFRVVGMGIPWCFPTVRASRSRRRGRLRRRFPAIGLA